MGDGDDGRQRRSVVVLREGRGIRVRNGEI